MSINLAALSQALTRCAARSLLIALDLSRWPTTLLQTRKRRIRCAMKPSLVMQMLTKRTRPLAELAALN